MVDSAPSGYVGRFAPSPTGHLHLGSLTCALGSYLDARQHAGSWLLRVENIDPPREQAGAAEHIIRCLADHGLESDRPILWQHLRSDAYQNCLARLAEEQLIYPCNCSRQRLTSLGGRYDGHCRRQPPQPPYALRLKVVDLPAHHSKHARPIEFVDRHLGLQIDDVRAKGDFIIHRKDGLFAYQLAVVVDDIAQGITHVVRGSDILDSTGRQIFLFDLLQKPAPIYCHLPVLSNSHGQKLSKQNFAPEIYSSLARDNLWQALLALGSSPPPELKGEAPSVMIDWAIKNWSISQLPQGMTVTATTQLSSATPSTDSPLP